MELLKGQPLLIMLDELPPYFAYAKSQAVGNSDLSVDTATALSNLLVAVGKEELANVCVIITDLTATYAEGSRQLNQALGDLDKETGRTAMRLEPVRMNTDEFYHILRRRLFSELPPPEAVAEVAAGYAKSIKQARQMDVTNASPEQFAARIAESYPFHPAIRDLYARFKENPGFQQTRGLIRLMRIVAARLWSTGEHQQRHLIGAQDLDLNDRDTLTEINQINPTLENAISHDIASNGQAVAEVLDNNLGGHDAQDVMRLLLVSSLSTVAGASKGLTVPETVAALCQPGRDLAPHRSAQRRRPVRVGPGAEGHPPHHRRAPRRGHRRQRSATGASPGPAGPHPDPVRQCAARDLHHPLLPHRTEADAHGLRHGVQGQPLRRLGAGGGGPEGRDEVHRFQRPQPLKMKAF